LHEITNVIFHDLHRLAVDGTLSLMVDTTQAAVEGIWWVHFNALTQQLPAPFYRTAGARQFEVVNVNHQHQL